MKFSRTKRIIILILALVILIGSVFAIRACSAPPKYEEIEARFKQLMEDSYGVNVILFGEGLPTYERISDPRDSLKVYNTDEFYTDEDGEEHRRKFWYYTTLDDDRVIAFRDSYLKAFSYAYVTDSAEGIDSIKAKFPLVEDISAPEESEFYSQIYSKDGTLAYLVPFVEKKVDFYYSASDPENYDYVRNDAPYRTVESIKTYAEAVYSKNYMTSLYSSLFDGVASGGTVMNARYVERTRSDNTVWLTQSNTYESLFSERRVYLYDTSQIIKWGSNRNFVRISIDSYLPSNPQKIEKIEVNLTLQNGQWFLDSPTF